jgi:hypothetical protein
VRENVVREGRRESIVFFLRNNWMSTDPDIWSLIFPPDIWKPIGEFMSTTLSLASTLAIILALIYMGLLYFDTTKLIPGAWNPWVIFWIVVVVGLIFLAIAWSLAPLKLFGVEVFSSSPNTCVGNKSSLEGGLCYNSCRTGYHGFGVRCYADTVQNGEGNVVGLEPCRDGYRTEGLLCSSVRGDNCAWKLFGACMPGLTGDVYGRLDHGGVCPGPQDFGGDFDTEYKKWKKSNDKAEPVIDPKTGQIETAEQATTLGHKTCDDISMVGTNKHTEKIDGMCYKKCPSENPEHVPGMPYLCFKGGELSYDRGGGMAPPLFRFFGKYSYPW